MHWRWELGTGGPESKGMRGVSAFFAWGFNTRNPKPQTLQGKGFTGFRVPLPQSPDTNPTEQRFELLARLRRSAEDDMYT